MPVLPDVLRLGAEDLGDRCAALDGDGDALREAAERRDPGAVGEPVEGVGEVGARVDVGESVPHLADELAVSEMTVRRDLAPAMTSEDFSHFLLKRPGAFLWVGNGPVESGTGLHNPRYNFNDAILPSAATALAAAAKRALREGA
mgnify:CR=1 FL=1